VKTIGIPVSVFRVACEIASGRPFAMTERTILKSIAAGNVEFEALVADLSLHPRLVTECLTALFEAGIIEFQQGGGAFSITSIGDEALSDARFIPSTLRSVRVPFHIVVDRVTGLADVSSHVTFERSDELRARGTSILPPSDIDPTPGRSAIRRLIERRALRSGEWIRSVGRPEPRFRYNSAVQVDVREGRIERLRSTEWVRALTLALRERAFDLAQPSAVEPDLPWIAVTERDISGVSGATEHAHVLENALERATHYVFIHSAFLTGTRAEQLAQPIGRALQRGVDVIVARGGSEESTDADHQGAVAFTKLAYDYRLARGRFFFEPYPTGSHAKILLWDWEHVCIGSFNWLSAQSKSPRVELSLLVSSVNLAVAVCDVAADLFREDRVAWQVQVLRSRASSEFKGAAEDAELAVRLVADADNRECLFAYLEQAEDRLVIKSDKVTAREDPMLRERLLQKARSLVARSQLTIRFNAIDGDRAPLLDGLRDAGAVIVEDGKNHAKVLLRDDTRALVTSFNLLSFGGRSGRRSSGFELGLELRTSRPAPELFKRLFAALAPE
jgi:phosphatidylserine/phosphatidylglycerophosphate/cardiolipin synthase-like enzyme